MWLFMGFSLGLRFMFHLLSARRRRRRRLFALRAACAPQAASLYYYILRLHFAFRISHLLFTLCRHSRLLSLSTLIAAFGCISLRGICVDSLKGMHNAKIP